jgi:hypothetical protein
MIETISAEDLILQTDSLKIVNFDATTFPINLIRSSSPPGSLDYSCGSLYIEIGGSSSSLYLKQDNGVSSNFTALMKGFTVYGDTGSLLIEEEGNISIVGTGGTSTDISGTVMTITASASYLGDLLDVNLASPAPVDKDILRYDGGTGFWMADQELFTRTDQGGGDYTLSPFDMAASHVGSSLLLPNFIDLSVYVGSSPSASYMTYIRMFANLDTTEGGLCTVDDAGVVTEYTGESLFYRRSSQVLVDPKGTTVTNIGLLAAPTLTGTLANVDDADGPWLKHTSGTNANDPAGPISAAFTYFMTAWDPQFIATIITPTLSDSIGNTRVWVGFTETNIDTSNDPTTSVAAFLYSGGANWSAYTNDNGVGGTTTDTGVAFVDGTKYTMRIECYNDAVDFYINNILVATNTTNLPASFRYLGWCIRAVNVPALGSARDIKWGRVAILHK